MESGPANRAAGRVIAMSFKGKWTADEDLQLLQLHAGGAGAESIGLRLGRSADAINTRLSILRRNGRNVTAIPQRTEQEIQPYGNGRRKMKL